MCDAENMYKSPHCMQMQLCCAIMHVAIFSFRGKPLIILGIFKEMEMWKRTKMSERDDDGGGERQPGSLDELF